MQKRKRGSHIDIVLSFVIFIFVLVFIFSILVPRIKISDKQAIIDYLKLKLIGNFSSNFTTFTIQVTSEITKDCGKATQNFLDDLVKQDIDETKLVIKDEDSNVIKYYIQGGQLIIGTGIGFIGLLKFYYSDSLNPSYCPGGKPECGFGPDCTVLEYEIGLIRETNIIIYSNIQELADKYNTDYEGLKSELGIPPGTEFAFIFTASDGTTIIAEPKEIPAINVYTEEFPVTYSDSEGNILEGFLTIKVW